MTSDEMLLEAMATADEARARQTREFHRRWGHFWKCPTCGMAFKRGHWVGRSFHCVPNKSMIKDDKVPPEYDLLLTGYDPPPNG